MEELKTMSMDEFEKNTIEHELPAVERPFVFIKSKENVVFADKKEKSVSLNENWEMVDGGYTKDRLDLDKKWEDSFFFNVPCSVHKALFEAKKIPNPVLARNDKIARENSYKIWWFKKEFKKEDFKKAVLKFDGVCYFAMIWLNGKYLGYHKGMFGSFEYDISSILSK